jgi:hypothetical protein
MSLADDMMPEDCIEACAETIEENLKAVLANIPTGNECSNAELAKKYTVLGKCFRSIKEYTKEALKATQKGSDSIAFNLIEASKHKPLSEFADATVEVSIDGGSKVTVPFEKFEKAAQGVE